MKLTHILKEKNKEGDAEFVVSSFQRHIEKFLSLQTSELPNYRCHKRSRLSRQRNSISMIGNFQAFLKKSLK